MKEKDELIEFKYQSALFFGVALFVLCYSLGQFIHPFYIIGNYVQNGFLLVLMIYFLVVIGSGYRNGYFKLGNLANYSIFALAIAGFISCMVNGHKNITIYGDEFQGAGLITLFSYYVLFVAASLITRKKYREMLVHFMLVFFSMICIYGMLQYFNFPRIIKNIVVVAAHYPTRNQNAFAVFPIYLFGIVFGLILYGKETKKAKFAYYLVLAIAYSAAMCSFSALVYVAFIMHILLAVFLELITGRKKFLPLIFVLIEMVILFILFNFISKGYTYSEFSSLQKEISESGSVVDNTVGNGRVSLWKETIKALKNYWIWGCGIEEFAVDYDYFGTIQGSCEAHNGYLHLWSEQGILAIISYLVFLFSLFIPGVLQFVKNKWFKGDVVSKVMLFAFFGFIAQDFVNINMLHVGPYFWPICGLLFIPRNKETVTVEKESLTKEAE